MTVTSTTCPFCAVGCGMLLDAQNGRHVEVHPDRLHPVSRGQLCAKGWNATQFLRSPDRLTRPLVRRHGVLEPATWDEALTVAAGALAAARREGGADAVGVIASARAANEDAFAAMKLARAVLGTNNVDHCARVCHAPSVAGLRRTLGSGAMTNPIADIDRADCLLVAGADSTENHPIIGARMLEAHGRGVPLIVIDPRRTRLARAADLHLAPRLGTDIPLVNGMIHAIFAHGWEDRAYLAARCEHVEALRAAVAPFTPTSVARTTGVAAADIVQAARLYAESRRAFLAYGLGITQHVSGTENVIALSNLALVCGHVGVDGGGINPLRGQNNVQGACDVGGLPNVYTGYQSVVDPNVRKKFEDAWGHPLSGTAGLTLPDIFDAIRKGKIKAVYCIGENPAVSEADITHAREALEKLEFLVCQDIFLNDTGEMAHVVLPAASFAEKDGTFTNTERRVQRVRKALGLPGSARPDWLITAQIAQKMGAKGFDWPSPAAVMDEVARLTPSYGGISFERIEKGGLQWPCPTKEHPGTPILHKEVFSRGKGRFMPLEYRPPRELPDEDFPLTLTTKRSLYQYHTGTMTRKVEGLNTLLGEEFVEINPVDAAQLSITDGEWVGVASRRGEVRAKAKVSQITPPGVVSMDFHFAESPVNRLTNPALDPVSKIPEFKACAVRVAKETK